MKLIFQTPLAFSAIVIEPMNTSFKSLEKGILLIFFIHSKANLVDGFDSGVSDLFLAIRST